MKLKIGYVPYLPDLSQPGDRRRFPYFAKRKGIEFEIASVDKKYDIILLTAPSNLTKWLKYKQQYPETKFIFEMVDGLVFKMNTFTTLFKGSGRYFLGRESNLIFNYKTILDKWIKIADVVVCSNKELSRYIKKININCAITPDYLESEYSKKKQNFFIDRKLKIVWEGMPSVLIHFSAFKKVFSKINNFCELHVITTEKYPVIPLLYHKKTKSFLKKLPIKAHFHKWDHSTNLDVLIKSDCAIIPINKKYQLAWFKPANKLVSFWFSGLPTITSATPEYKNLMDSVDSNLYCNNEYEWVEKLKYIYNLSPEKREEIAQKNFDFVKNNYSDERLDKIWEDVLNLISNQK